MQGVRKSIYQRRVQGVAPKEEKKRNDEPVVEVYKGDSAESSKHTDLAASARQSLRGSKFDGVEDSQILESDPNCKFCSDLFQGNERDKFQAKKRMLLELKTIRTLNKEEEYFKMCLLSFQLQNLSNKKVMGLDAKELFVMASQKEKLPFFKWNGWLQKQIEKIQFEEMYKRK